MSQFKPGNKAAEKYKPEYAEKLLSAFEEEANAGEYPTFESFARKIGVVRNTLDHWRENYPRFAHAIARAKDIQKDILMKRGLSGAFNPNFAKFVAVNCHGMAEKSESDTKLHVDIDWAKIPEGEAD